MDKIKLIIAREYLSRVKKRSFIIMTILGPILMASMVVIPILLTQIDDKDQSKIAVLDESGLFFPNFKSDKTHLYYKIEKTIDKAKSDLAKGEHDILLYIPKKMVSLPTQAFLYAESQPSMNLKSYVERVMSKELEEQKLKIQIDSLNLSEEKRKIAMNIPKAIKTSINISTIKLDENEKEQRTYSGVNMGLSFFVGFMIYMFIFIFGVQVMRGVIEEKTSRIIEVMICSVKPFQLMMGKIIGIAMVGFTQFLLWVILTTGIISVVQVSFQKDITANQNITATSQLVPTQEEVVQGSGNKVLDIIASINFSGIIFSFAFYFLFGYLLYAALFAIVGSAVDNETDTQQFMMPITIPLILSIIMLQFVLRNPDGPVSFWMSIIPFTSPVIMMGRIPFGVPYEELALSMALLILTFWGATWMAGRIYRIGILMYGKKPTYKELFKWIRYKG